MGFLGPDRLFPTHSTRKNLSLDDLVNRAPGDLPGPRKDGSAAVTTKIPGRPVLDDSLNETFDEGTRTALAIAVKQQTTAGTMDRNGAAFRTAPGHPNRSSRRSI